MIRVLCIYGRVPVAFCLWLVAASQPAYGMTTWASWLARTGSCAACVGVNCADSFFLHFLKMGNHERTMASYPNVG